MITNPGMPLCPVDGCPQPHADQVADLLDNPLTITLPDYPRRVGARAVSDALTEVATARQRAIDDVVMTHARSHDVIDYLATIHHLQCELDDFRSGIRPQRPPRHAPQPDQTCTPPAVEQDHRNGG